MEVAGLALSAAQTLLAALGCTKLQHVFSMWGYQSELESLQRTVSCVQAVLLDAQSRDHFKFTHFERDTIQKLKDALYEADDLLDEFATLARQGQITHDNFLGKVRRLFPRFKKLNTVHKLSKEVQKIRKMLDQTTKEAAMFGFNVKLDPQHNRVFSRDETHSYANENDIVGRDEDKRRIVDILLDPNVQENVYVLTIVGVGGLGKTALAQLVYNDQRIESEFHNRRFWACVSDQDQTKTDKCKAILANILKAVRGEAHLDSHTHNNIVQELRKKLGEGKYMMVLDDVWTENPFQSQEWLGVLKGSAQRGSRIVVTTRSKGTATAVSSNHVYELQGLSDESSWRLFEMVVGKEQANHPDLKEMGEDIVKKCANVPLPIKVLGSLLHNQEKKKWRRFHQSKLNEIRRDDSSDHVMEILKFSYYHLRPELKTCFAYCAVFPKDFWIERRKLLWLWMAQGFVKPLNDGQLVEEAAEEYFQILVQRCFFQDVEWYDYEETTYFKIHDLMHDVAQEVVGNEIIVGNSHPRGLDKRVRHLFDDRSRSYYNNIFETTSKIRTYVQVGGLHQRTMELPVSSLLANWRCIRALDLSWLGIHILPSEVGELIHLRYINLSENDGLTMLPASFTRLINLEILIMEGCCKLKELPKDFCKLVNLRTLYLWTRQAPLPKLSYMPLGLGKLRSLTQLDWFVVANRGASLKHDVGGLRDLKSLTNLRGSLKIWISSHYEHVKEDGGEESLRNKDSLNDIRIQFECRECDEETSERERNSDEDVLEDLVPHRNLEVLGIEGYKGWKIPSWARQDNLTTFLPNLVKIIFENIYGVQELSYLSGLRSLKVLQVSCMYNLRYIENRSTGDASRSSCGAQAAESSCFFPSLEELHLIQLPMLEGWWNRPSVLNYQLPSFPHLSMLHIRVCPRLSCMPLCPTVEKIELELFNDRLQIMIEDEEENRRQSGGRTDPGKSSHVPKLRYMETDNLRYLGSLPGRALHNLEEIVVKWDDKVESLSEVGEALQSCSSSLRYLQISNCNKLRSVLGGLEYLTVLESLKLDGSRRYRIEEDDMQWRCLGHCLRSLDIEKQKISKEMTNLTSLQSLTIWGVEEIPEWIGCLSSLQSLTIGAPELETVPEGMRTLTSLTRLQFNGCSKNLKRRCQQPDGEEWPKIQHIPNIDFKRCYGYRDRMPINLCEW